jgi:3-mercaptopyruvate sulfurtransferase SseA
MKLIWPLRGVAFVVVAGIIALVLSGALRVAPSLAEVQASDDVRRVTPDEVRDLLKQNKAVLVDVRDKNTYNAGHIKGALSIPFGEIGERAKELPRDKMILAYCS